MRSSDIVVPVSALRRALVVFIVVLALGGVLLLAWQQRESLGGGIFAGGVRDQIDPNAYQAVFLTGGQVYFGKLTARGDDHYLLSDVFYLSAGDAQQTADPQRPQIIKRGTELHGPREPMIILARSVLFIENLREDAQVGQAIRRFKAGEIPTATPTPSRTPASPAATARPSPTR